MARKRVDLGSDSDKRIRDLLARGCTVDDVALALGTSRATAARRCRELRKGVQQEKADLRAKLARPLPPPPAEDDEGAELVLPEGTGLAEIDRLYQVALERSRLSEGEGDDKAHQGWVRLASQLLESRRKLAPPPKVDPNEHPDMIAAAKRAREALHRLIITSPEGT